MCNTNLAQNSESDMCIHLLDSEFIDRNPAFFTLHCVLINYPVLRLQGGQAAFNKVTS